MTSPSAPQSGIPFVDPDRTLSSSGLIFLQQLRNAVIGGTGNTSVVRRQRAVTSALGAVIMSNDSILNINSVTDLAPSVPLASTRNGAPLTFKNIPGSHAQTITSTTPDTFDGITTYILAPGAYLTLMPYNDGVNSGYAIE